MERRYNNTFSTLNSKSPSRGLALVGEALTPLMECPNDDAACFGSNIPESRTERWSQWMRSRLPWSHPSASTSCSDLRLLLSVMGAPLAPFHVSTADPFPQFSLKNNPIQVSPAKYIIQQYIAAVGGLKHLNSINNTYVLGKVRMIASEFEAPTKAKKNRGGGSSLSVPETGGFVLWQMKPNMWCIELALGGSKICAGSNGGIVWRQNPWLGAHAAKGPVRPLRRVIQGLDPLTTATMFTKARCIAERNINGEDCFILKLCASDESLKSRCEGPAELIRHNLLGYFSQRTGLLIQIEDSQLTRIQANCHDESIYWETNIISTLEDYRSVEGVMIAHSGRSVVTLYRFGETAMSHTRTRMEEAWTIDEVAFNVHGLSLDCFIPPADMKTDSFPQECLLQASERGKSTNSLIGGCAKVAALESSCDHHHAVDRIYNWQVES
ncbi:DUF620 family protein (DUF620) [Rhynchospora pubera]|uniref:DUF620 family protein (DUF620) n=1 Tax=Rhynchospora pubera TaxID=906938 RepID=A0AAV8FS40_9POAL|nr:DUF620 family protein (DUF620) [Rhynchospora pubera]